MSDAHIREGPQGGRKRLRIGARNRVRQRLPLPRLAADGIGEGDEQGEGPLDLGRVRARQALVDAVAQRQIALDRVVERDEPAFQASTYGRVMSSMRGPVEPMSNGEPAGRCGGGTSGRSRTVK